MSTKSERRRRRLRYRLRVSMSPAAWKRLVAEEAEQRATEQRAALSKPQPAPVAETPAERATRRREEAAARRQHQHELMMSAIAEGKQAAARQAERNWENAQRDTDEAMGPQSDVTLSPSASAGTRRALLGGAQ